MAEAKNGGQIWLKLKSEGRGKGWLKLKGVELAVSQMEGE